jgi:hypothetical protein
MVVRSMLTTFNLWKGTDKVGYEIDVEHSTYLQVLMPTSVIPCLYRLYNLSKQFYVSVKRA